MPGNEEMKGRWGVGWKVNGAELKIVEELRVQSIGPEVESHEAQ